MAAFVFKLEKPSIPLVGVVAMISGGLILFRAKEGISFHSTGFLLVMSASAMGGLRWVLTQLILHKEKERLGLKVLNPLPCSSWRRKYQQMAPLTICPFCVPIT